MNKVITINLGGNAYQLEEDGYNALRIYLDTAASRLAGNPDREEILSDIERAIGEKFRALLGSHKNVITIKEVGAVIAEMGTIEAEPGETSTASTSAGTGTEKAAGQKPGPKRLYRINEGAMFLGVCNGIGAYCNVDPTLVRLAFAFAGLFGGVGVGIYLVMACTVPEARSPEEKAAASGDSATAQEFIRRAKEGYYEALKHFPDKKTRREWHRRFHREMRGHARRWQYQWSAKNWPQGGVPGNPGMALALPLFSLLQGAVKILGICAFISLLTTNGFFGVMIPTGLPVWVAVVVLFFIYATIASPLKFARRACYQGMGNAGWGWPVVFLMDAVVWVMVAGTLAWLAFHYFPQWNEAVKTIPDVAHQAVADVRSWWKK